MKNKYLIILSIIVLAFALRFFGIWHAWPYSYYYDEISKVKRALAFGSGDLNPHWFHKPAFLMYVLFFEYGLYFLIGKLIGFWHSVSVFAVHYIRNPGPFYLIGRSTIALFGIGTIAVVYEIGERHFKRGAGIMAALFLTLSYGHVVMSQNIKCDIPAAFFVVLSMLFLLNFLKDKKIKNIILSTIFAGIGTATKYYPIAMLVPIFFANIEVNRHSDVTLRKKIVKITSFLILLIFVFTVTCFICAPYNFIDPLALETSYRVFIEPFFNILNKIKGDELVQEPYNFILYRSGYFEAFIEYIRNLISKVGIGIVIGSISLIGTIALFFRSVKHRFIFLLYPFVFLLISVFLYPGFSGPRHQASIYPFLAIAGGWFVVNLTGQKSLQRKIIYGIILLSLFHPLFNIVERDFIISRKDTRQLAKEWVEKNIPPGTKLLLDEHAPRLLESEESLQRQLETISNLQEAVKKSSGQFTTHYKTYIEYKMLAAKGALTYDITEFRFPWWRYSFNLEEAFHLTEEYDVDMGNPFRTHGVHSYDYYVENGYQYVIVNADRRDFYEKNEERYPFFARFFRELFKRGSLVKKFSSSEGDRRPGPTICIFKIGKNVTDS